MNEEKINVLTMPGLSVDMETRYGDWLHMAAAYTG